MNVYPQIKGKWRMILDNGYIYEVIGEQDNGKKIIIHISSNEKLNTAEAVCEAWSVIMNDFHWSVTVDKGDPLKQYEENEDEDIVWIKSVYCRLQKVYKRQ
jgi:hypothetical protein